MRSSWPASGLIVAAVRALTAEGRVLPADLGGRARTTEVGDAVVAKMRALAK
jgi:isocitrate/isopropylmalate dehydrogenase